MDKERFSMLLLEPGEIYFEDYSVVWVRRIDGEGEKSEDGRLKLCSKSLVFEPRDRARPLIKIQFKECEEIAQCEDVRRAASNNIVSVKCRQHAEMLEANRLAPYKFRNEEREFWFLLNYASIGDCVQQMNQLRRAASLHACEQNSMVATISHSRYSRMRFDLLWLENIYDAILAEMNADRISPLVQNPGKVVLTENTLFFQPCNNIEPYPVLRIKIADIRRLFKRRFLLRQTGLEIYNDSSSEVAHIYLAFKTPSDRDRIYESILALPLLTLDNMEQSEMTMQWQNGVLSNYDYLLYLNCLADRTKNDLTQYPVFPWVLSDYVSSKIDLEDVSNYRDLSKPVGALNEERLERLKERYQEMAPPKFLYGSHYSAPGLVLFYIVRMFPNYMLCLQNGRFDHPDRMFNSISDVYRNCLNNMADFKELIPEFYDVASEGEFLTNKYGIHFGYRHDGAKVENVHLPEWAESSPRRFVQIMRDALESQYVSNNLHNWIDLIFGHKQSGAEAEAADNVFYHLCYEGAVDLDDIADMNERHALEVQIMEFGQIPKRLFRTPHVRRIMNGVKRPLSEEKKTMECLAKIARFEERMSFHSHKGGIGAVIVFGDDEQSVVSVGKDSLLKIYSLGEERQTRSVNVGSATLSSCVQMSSTAVIVGSWDNYIILYDFEYGRVVDSFRAHDDSVTCLIWSKKDNTLISGGSDSMVRIWNSLDNFGKNTFRPLKSLYAEFEHDSKVTSIAVDSSMETLATGTDDGDVILWNVVSKTKKRCILCHSSPITGICFTANDKRLLICSLDGEFRVYDLGVNTQVFNKAIKEGVTSMVCTDNLLFLGGARGTLYVWDLLVVAQILEVKAHADAINSLAIGTNNSMLVTASEDRSVKIWKFKVETES